MVEKDGFEPEVSLAVSPTAQSPLSPLRPWFCLRHRLLPARVGRCPQPESRVPSLRPHATGDPSVPAPRIGSRRLAGLPLGDLLWHRGDRLPRSAQEPLAGLTPSSCRSPLGQSAGSLQTAACKRRKKQADNRMVDSRRGSSANPHGRSPGTRVHEREIRPCLPRRSRRHGARASRRVGRHIRKSSTNSSKAAQLSSYLNETLTLAR